MLAALHAFTLQQNKAQTDSRSEFNLDESYILRRVCVHVHTYVYNISYRKHARHAAYTRSHSTIRSWNNIA